MMDMTTFTRDRNAPRFRPTRFSLQTNDYYIRKFRKRNPKFSNLSEAKFSHIIKTYNEQIWKTTIEEREGAELPEGLGYLFIGICKASKKGLNIDIKTSLEYGRPLRHRSGESDGYLAKIFYTNYASKYKFQFRDLWQFVGTRNYKTAVATSYAQRWKSYIQVDSTRFTSKIFKKLKMRDFAIKINSKLPENYNEFDMN